MWEAAQAVESLPHNISPWLSPENHIAQGWICACDPSAWEVEARLETQGPSCLQREFKASLVYIRAFLKNKKLQCFFFFFNIGLVMKPWFYAQQQTKRHDDTYLWSQRLGDGGLEVQGLPRLHSQTEANLNCILTPQKTSPRPPQWGCRWLVVVLATRSLGGCGLIPSTRLLLRVPPPVPAIQQRHWPPQALRAHVYPCRQATHTHKVKINL